jgi:hypothetical protein
MNGKHVSRLSPFKRICWDEMDEVKFQKGSSGSLGLAGWTIERSMGKVTGSSEFDDLFVKGLFTVTFSYQGRPLCVFKDAQARSCVLIAQALDCFSPIDLVNVA